MSTLLADITSFMRGRNSTADFNSLVNQQRVYHVYKLAGRCRCADLHEEKIRDCTVVGIRDAKLSERLQLDPNLTLNKTMTQVRQNEEIKRQQPIIRREKSEVKEVNVDAVVTQRTSKEWHRREHSGQLRERNVVIMQLIK